MRTIFVVFISILFLVSCGTGGSFILKGTLNNSRNDKLWLKEMTINGQVIVDSIKIDEQGNFKLKRKIDKSGFFTLSTSDKDNYITLIIKPGDEITLNANVKELGKTYQVKGSKDAELVRELSAKLDSTLDKISDLGKIYEDSINSRNLLKIRAHLDSVYNVIEEDQVKFTEKFIRTNIQSLASLMALYQQLSPRTSVLNPTDHYEYYKMVDSSMMSLYPDADAVKSLHMLINDVGEQNQRKEQLEKRTGIGAIAPEIALPNPKGDTLRLSSTRGKYVLLDFWASWCQPCRNENPNLLRLYWRYKYNGFEIFQVSLDKTKESWIKGITDDKLAWINVSDLKFWNSPVVALYGIESIPYNLLLDTKGEIIGKDLQGEKLASKLREIFKY
jgi:thiol-disulfide isomerase/thioredoxin